MELLITMILSSIVVAISGVSFEILSKQYNEYKNTNNSILCGITFDTVLKNDFVSSEKIIKSQNGITLFKRNGEMIDYKVSPENILREVNHVQDTFFLPVLGFHIYFQKQEQALVNGYVDELFFESVLCKEKQHFHFCKLYGSTK